MKREAGDRGSIGSVGQKCWLERRCIIIQGERRERSSRRKVISENKGDVKAKEGQVYVTSG